MTQLGPIDLAALIVIASGSSYLLGARVYARPIAAAAALRGQVDSLIAHCLDVERDRADLATIAANLLQLMGPGEHAAAQRQRIWDHFTRHKV